MWGCFLHDREINTHGKYMISLYVFCFWNRHDNVHIVSSLVATILLSHASSVWFFVYILSLCFSIGSCTGPLQLHIHHTDSCTIMERTWQLHQWLDRDVWDHQLVEMLLPCRSACMTSAAPYAMQGILMVQCQISDLREEGWITGNKCTKTTF